MVKREDTIAAPNQEEEHLHMQALVSLSGEEAVSPLVLKITKEGSLKAAAALRCRGMRWQRESEQQCRHGQLDVAPCVMQSGSSDVWCMA